MKIKKTKNSNAYKIEITIPLKEFKGESVITHVTQINTESGIEFIPDGSKSYEIKGDNFNLKLDYV